MPAIGSNPAGYTPAYLTSTASTTPRFSGESAFPAESRGEGPAPRAASPAPVNPAWFSRVFASIRPDETIRALQSQIKKELTRLASLKLPGTHINLLETHILKTGDDNAKTCYFNLSPKGKSYMLGIHDRTPSHPSPLFTLHPEGKIESAVVSSPGYKIDVTSYQAALEALQTFQAATMQATPKRR